MPGNSDLFLIEGTFKIDSTFAYMQFEFALHGK